MPTDRRVPTLVVNTLTEAQYRALENPSDTEMWVTPYDESILPNQTGQSGKFLTTDGTDASWATVNALPSQTGQSGKYLTTDGSSASWGSVDINGKANVSLDNLSSAGQGKFDAKVSKTGDTMTGMLTISKADDHIRAQDTVLDVNTTPSSSLNGGYYSITDKNNNLITRLYSSNTTDGYNVSALQVWSGTSANTAASMGIRMKQDGTDVFAFCPTPAAASNANHIATTAWVRRYAPYITAAYVNGTSWYRVWSNGWCEQGGIASSSSVQQITVNLLLSFANTNYTLVSQQERNSQSGYSHPTIYSKSTGSFVLFADSGTNNNWYACGTKAS